MYKKHIKALENKVWLSSPTMYEDSMQYAMEAYNTNWMSTVGENINVLEKELQNWWDARKQLLLHLVQALYI